MEIWARQNASTTLYFCSLPNVISGFTLGAEYECFQNSHCCPKWDVLIPQNHCLFSCFHTRYLAHWPDFFSLYISMLWLLLPFLLIMLKIKEVWRFLVGSASRCSSISTGTKTQLTGGWNVSSGVAFAWSEYLSAATLTPTLFLPRFCYFSLGQKLPRNVAMNHNFSAEEYLAVLIEMC